MSNSIQQIRQFEYFTLKFSPIQARQTIIGFEICSGGKYIRTALLFFVQQKIESYLSQRHRYKHVQPTIIGFEICSAGKYIRTVLLFFVQQKIESYLSQRHRYCFEICSGGKYIRT